MAYKPDGYTSVSPYPIVDDPEKTIVFLEKVFDAKRLRVHHRDDGGIAHAEVRIDDTVVMLGGMPGVPACNIHVYVSDVDAAIARALAAGGSEVQPAMEKGDGDRRGGVADPNGIVWWISTQVQA